MVRKLSLIVLLLMLSVSAFAQVSAVPQLMNFQGRLAKPDGTPVANGTYSIRFSLHSALTGGTENWNQTVASVTVRNGTFAVQLSGFPANTFNSNQWLQIKIGTAAPLTPRQQLITVAYAFKADMALTVPDASITNAKIATGTLTADRFAANIFNPLAWLLGGNSGTNGNQFLGTTDNQPLAFKVNNRKAMRYSYAENTATTGLEYRSINILGGSDINSISAGVVGATIAGGGEDYFTGTDFPNRVLAKFGTVGGGRSNTASGDSSTIGGGYSNTASGNAAAIAGGNFNIASGNNATVAGGYLNTASGFAATVAGGFSTNAIGQYSFAAGRRAKANHDGAFVWGDSTDADFASTATNQFLIRAVGGVGINIANPVGNAFVIQNDSLSNITQTWYAPTKGANYSHAHYGNSGDWYIRSAANAGKVVIQDNGGNVGIGKNNPLSPLDVQGDVRLSGVGNGLIFPDGTKQTTAGGGGGGWSLTGNAGINPATQFLRSVAEKSDMAVL